MGYMGDSFTGQVDPTNSIKVLKGKRYKVRKKTEKGNNTKYSNTIETHIQKHSKSPSLH